MSAYERGPIENRFWPRVLRGGSDECWPWTGKRNTRGYGTMGRGGRCIIATRISWELAHKEPVPKELSVCHTCDNPSCVNPAHLFLGSARTNGADMSLKGRAANQYGGQDRTHCINGHEYTAENTYWRPGKVSSRDCRACVRARGRKYDSQRRSAAGAPCVGQLS